MNHVLYSTKLINRIDNLTFDKKSLLFAEISRIAYKKRTEATKDAKNMGFTRIKFFSSHTSQVFMFMNEFDIVIACCGFGLTQKIQDVVSKKEYCHTVLNESGDRVHKGFKHNVDKIWPLMLDDISEKYDGRNFWLTGHSLGAAMCTIMAKRCSENMDTLQPKEIYTYGSPRVGFSGFVKKCVIPHYRWRKYNDTLTILPSQLLGYRHHGTECYLNSYGKHVKPTKWRMITEFVNGVENPTTRLDYTEHHHIHNYIVHLKNIVSVNNKLLSIKEEKSKKILNFVNKCRSYEVEPIAEEYI